ncbi:DUF4913 domain-containing protein [Microbacterium sp. NPDC055988]|uniref:DUF4913 domain-containing protein n=1 Tax=Microbacterium sp. NPDC055988 TaxID=3345671 RepID=UPI0035DDEB0E
MIDDDAPAFDEGMSLDDLVAKLGEDPDFSDQALADRHGTTPLNPQLTINWREINDEDRPDACRELVSWVHDWLIPRYQVKAKVIPDCWWEHSEYIEELSALHTAWLVAFDAADGGWGPIGWHERYALAQTRSPLNKERCAGEHRPDLERSMPKAPTVF